MAAACNCQRGNHAQRLSTKGRFGFTSQSKTAHTYTEGQHGPNRSQTRVTNSIYLSIYCTAKHVKRRRKCNLMHVHLTRWSSVASSCVAKQDDFTSDTRTVECPLAGISHRWPPAPAQVAALVRIPSVDTIVPVSCGNAPLDKHDACAGTQRSYSAVGARQLTRPQRHSRSNRTASARRQQVR